MQRWPWLVLVLAVGSSSVHADTHEVREYQVFVDGKEAGSSTLDIKENNEGLQFVVAKANVRFQQVVLPYTLNVEAAEWWKGGKLIGLKSQAIENGKKTEVVVAPEAGQLRAKVNGQDRKLAADVWTTSFWKLPDARVLNQAVVLFEPDTGKEIAGELRQVGTETITVGSQPVPCGKFRVTGGASPIELWFDAGQRLVRQKFQEAGHETVVQLVSVKR